MALLAHPLAPARARRFTTRAALSSSAAVARTHSFDGRTSVIAIRDAHGWRRVRRLRWTPDAISTLRAEQVREVVIKRGLRRGRLPLAWIPRLEEI